jgi:hypothetical protein
MCCGQKREALRNSGAQEDSAGADTSAAAKTAAGYYLRNVPQRLRGTLTGRPADFAKRPPQPNR